MSELDPRLLPWARHLVGLITQYDPQARLTSVYRSPSEQLELYRNRARNPYPVAPPGRSYHEYRRAFDIVAQEDVLRWAGQVWRSWGGTWGAERDPIHFQV